MSSLYILEIKPLSEVSLANVFSHMVGSLFILLIFFSHAEDFFYEVPFIYSFLYVPCSRGHISENIASAALFKEENGRVAPGLPVGSSRVTSGRKVLAELLRMEPSCSHQGWEGFGSVAGKFLLCLVEKECYFHLVPNIVASRHVK